MKRRPRVAFFGSSLLSAYWNGAATYYRGIIRELSVLGYRVTFFEPDAFARQEHRDIDPPDWAEVVVYPASQAGVVRALETARHYDLVVKASGVGVFDELLEREVLTLRSPERGVIFWDVDAPATLDRLRTDPGDAFRALVPKYDLVLTYGGGPRVVAGYRSFGARECVPVYNALDPTTHHPVAPQPSHAADLGFLGNRLPDREARANAFFFDVARRCPDLQFLLGGQGWEPSEQNIRWLGHVSTRDHNVFNCSVRMVLNVNRSSMAESGWSPPTRVFEAAGAGACLIVDAWEGIEAFLKPGEEVLVANDGAAVAHHLRNVDAERAARIGARARQRLLRQHTYAQRARQVDRILGGYATATAAAV